MYCIFVCTGNTCRSPMAEGYSNYLSSKYKIEDYFAESAGTHATEGLPAATNAIMTLKSIGIDISWHRSKLINKQMLDNADYIITMTEGHKEYINKIFPECKEKVYMLTWFLDKEHPYDIPDPVGGTLEEYKTCFGLIKSAINQFFENIVSKTNHKTCRD